MATPPPPPPGYVPPPVPRGSGGGGKLLLGCGAGCLVALLLAAGLGAFAFYKIRELSAEWEAQFAAMEEADERQRTARSRLTGLDESFPPRLPAAPAAAPLAADDVDRYLAVHAALAAPLAARRELQERVDAFEEKLTSLDDGAEPGFAQLRELWSGMSEAMDAGFEVEKALAALLEAGADALENQSLGPTDWRRLSAIVDLAFLQRAGLEELALSPDEALRLEGARSTVELWADETFDAEEWRSEEVEGLKANVEEARATVRKLEERIAAAAGLHQGSRAQLERRRAELEAVSDEAARGLLELTRKPEIFDWEAELESEVWDEVAEPAVTD